VRTWSIPWRVEHAEAAFGRENTRGDSTSGLYQLQEKILNMVIMSIVTFWRFEMPYLLVTWCEMKVLMTPTFQDFHGVEGGGALLSRDY
jgi:hypothetical protein